MVRAIARWLMIVPLAAGLLGGCKKKPQADLVLVSPHSEFTEKEFERAFSAWHEAKFGRPVKLEWRDIGGTTQITKYLKAQFSAAETAGIDIYFGGGAPDHKDLAAKGLLEKVELPAETLAQAPEQIGGVRQRDPEGRWYGACLSSFGIFYNAKLMNQKNLAEPTGWDDLAASALRDQVVAAGPKSGSARAAYELMLQTAPDWPAGWRRLLSFWANCQRFTEGASDVTALVSAGQAVAGTAIDYYAYTEMVDAEPGMLKFLTPRGGSVYTPDPISVLKGAPHGETARRFVEFVLSPEGQALWCLPAGTPGGPVDHALYRQPIRRDTYDQYKGKMLPELADDVFERVGSFEIDEKLQAARVTHILPRLMQAAAVDNSELLRAAWAKIVQAGRPAEMMDEFARLPDDLAGLDAMLRTADTLAQAEREDNARAIEEITGAWRTFFREKYQRLAGS